MPPPGPGRPFPRLLTATALSNLGDGVRAAALPLLAASLTDRPVLVAGAARRRPRGGRGADRRPAPGVRAGRARHRRRSDADPDDLAGHCAGVLGLRAPILLGVPLLIAAALLGHRGLRADPDGAGVLSPGPGGS